MVKDVTRENGTDMATTHQIEYKQDNSNQPATQPDPINQSSTGVDLTVQVVAQLLQAQKDWTLKDVAGQLRGTHAEQLMNLTVLVKVVSDTAKVEWLLLPT